MPLIINKFGGGIMNSADALKYLPEVFAQCGPGNCINVFSAFGKTTNNLEKVLKTYLDKDHEESERALQELKSFHAGITVELFPEGHGVFNKIEKIFEKIKHTLSSVTENTNPKFMYDQIIPSGEVLAATIASEYLASVGVSNKLVHATDFLKTDANFNAANVDKVATALALEKYIDERDQHVITEGFIGISDEGMTTLGREGSDYTAGILGNISNASKVILWKDVPGVMGKNPKLAGNEKVMKIDYMTYDELERNLESTAKGLVHPKTMNEVREKKIPLQVRPFWDLDSEGTIIHI